MALFFTAEDIAIDFKQESVSTKIIVVPKDDEIDERIKAVGAADMISGYVSYYDYLEMRMQRFITDNLGFTFGGYEPDPLMDITEEELKVKLEVFILEFLNSAVSQHP